MTTDANREDTPAQLLRGVDRVLRRCRQGSPSTIWRSLRDPEFRALFIVFLGLLIGGTGFYTSAEGWSLIDSLYFSVMTLSTVGYGDLSPTTDLSKTFTILYVLAGAGIFVAFISRVTEPGLHHRSPGRHDER